MTRGRRLVAELALLPVLYVLSLPDPVLFTNVIAAVLLVSPALTTSVAAILIWTSQQAPDIETLRERADDAATLSLMSWGAAFLAIVALLLNFGVVVPGKPVISILSWICILIVVPAVSWLGTWRLYWLPRLQERLRIRREAEQPR